MDALTPQVTNTCTSLGNFLKTEENFNMVSVSATLAQLLETFWKQKKTFTWSQFSNIRASLGNFLKQKKLSYGD